MENCYDFGFKQGISVIRKGCFFKDVSSSLIIASQAGEIKIANFNPNEEKWYISQEFDFSENGAIWNLEIADINNDGFDEIIIGGMKGAVVCITAKGEEIWNHQFENAISGIYIWKDHGIQENIRTKSEDDNLLKKTTKIIVYSHDRTLRVFNIKGEMLWAQMFASGVGCVSTGDINGNGYEEVIAGGNDGTLRIFDNRKGEILWFSELNTNIRSVVNYENQIICGGDDKKISIFDGKLQKMISEFKFPAYIWNLKIENNTILIATSFSFRYLGMDDDPAEPEIRTYSLPKMELIWKEEKHNIQEFSILTNSNKNHNEPLIIWGESNGKIEIRNLNNGKMIRDCLEKNIRVVPSVINSIQLMKKRILLGCDDGKIYEFKLNGV